MGAVPAQTFRTNVIFEAATTRREQENPDNNNPHPTHSNQIKE